MFNKTLYFFLAIFLLFTIGIKAQNNCSKINQPQWQWGGGSHWYFSDGVIAKMSANGMDFLPHTNSSTLGHRAYEATATYTDENGNLKYYTNGRQLWDADHVLINPNNLLLAGNENGRVSGNSGVQGVLFVKHPFNNTKLFIFTVDDELTNNGLNYYVLDMQTNILSSPIKLTMPDNFLGFKPTEQLAATFHENGSDIWVVSSFYNPSNVFSSNFILVSFLLRNDGLIMSSRTITDNTEFGFSAGGGSIQGRGSIKFSWDGKKVAVVNYANSSLATIKIFNFNNFTGKFVLNNVLGASKYFYRGVYDCEFSPDNKVLYVVGQRSHVNTEIFNDQQNDYTSCVTALDLTKTGNAINLSSKVVYIPWGGLTGDGFESENLITNSIKLAPDGKLYLTNYRTINRLPVNNTLIRLSGDLNNPFGSNWSSSSSLLVNEEIQLPPGKKAESMTFSNMFIPHSYNVPQFEIIAEDEVKVCDEWRYMKLKNLCTGEIFDFRNGYPYPTWSGNGIVASIPGVFDPPSAGVGQHIITYNNGGYVLTKTINVINHSTCNQTISDVISSKTCEGCSAFKPIAGKQYFLSAWASHQNVDNPALSKSGFTQMHIHLNFLNSGSTSVGMRDIYPSGQTIDGWKKVEDSFTIPSGTATIDIVFVNNSNADIYFDDLRIHPFEASMVSYVYNNETMQLVAELDDNNFHTKYIYDKEGNIVKMNVETVDGIRTVVETRTHIKK